MQSNLHPTTQADLALSILPTRAWKLEREEAPATPLRTVKEQSLFCALSITTTLRKTWTAISYSMEMVLRMLPSKFKIVLLYTSTQLRTEEYQLGPQPSWRMKMVMSLLQPSRLMEIQLILLSSEPTTRVYFSLDLSPIIILKHSTRSVLLSSSRKSTISSETSPIWKWKKLSSSTKSAWDGIDSGPSMTKPFTLSTHRWGQSWFLTMMRMLKCLSMSLQMAKENHKFKSM